MKNVVRILLAVSLLVRTALATIPTPTTWVQYVLSSNPQTLTVPFNFQNGSDLLVLDSKASPPVVLTQNSDYSVSGGNGSTGNVSTIAGGAHAVQVGDVITISRSVPLTQTTNFFNGGPLTASMIGQSFDKITSIAQQLNLVGARSLQFQPDETLGGVMPLTLRKSTVIGFDANGNLVFLPTSGIFYTTATPIQANTVALLTAMPLTAVANGQIIALGGYYANGDGGGGVVEYNSGSSATVDNGIVFATSGAGRFIRLYSGAVNARWFGAKADASTDDTNALQSAINSVYALGGGEIYFPPGNYRVTGALTCHQGMIFAGAGQANPAAQTTPIATIFTHAPGSSTTSDFLTLSTDPATPSVAYNMIEIRDLRIVGGAGAGHSRDGIYLNGAQARLTNVQVTAFERYGLRLNSMINSVFDRCQLSATVSAAYFNRQIDSGFATSTTCVFRACYFSGGGSGGQASVNCVDTTFTDRCIFESGAGDAITLYGGALTLVAPYFENPNGCLVRAGDRASLAQWTGARQNLHAYTLGALFSVGTNVYVVTTAGTSASSQPAGYNGSAGAPANDGSMVPQYLYPAGKIEVWGGAYIGGAGVDPTQDMFYLDYVNDAALFLTNVAVLSQAKGTILRTTANTTGSIQLNSPNNIPLYPVAVARQSSHAYNKGDYFTAVCNDAATRNFVVTTAGTTAASQPVGYTRTIVGLTDGTAIVKVFDQVCVYDLSGFNGSTTIGTNQSANLTIGQAAVGGGLFRPASGVVFSGTSASGIYRDTSTQSFAANEPLCFSGYAEVPQTAPIGNLGIVGWSDTALNDVRAGACDMFVDTSGNLVCRLYGSTTSDYRQLSFPIVTQYGGQTPWIYWDVRGGVVEVNSVPAITTETTAGTPPAWTAAITGTIYNLGCRGSGQSFRGMLARWAFWNAQPLPFDRTETFARAGIPSARLMNASQVNGVTSPNRNSNFSAGSTDWSGAAGGGAVVSGGALNVTAASGNSGASLGHDMFTPDSFYWPRFGRFRLRTTITSLSSNSVRFQMDPTGQPIVFDAVGNGTYDQLFTIPEVSNGNFYNVSTGGSPTWTITNFVVNRVGAFCFLPLDEGIGFQAHDLTTNDLDGLITNDGIAHVLPRRVGFVRGTLTWSATHGAISLTGAQALPAGGVVNQITTLATVGSSGTGLTVGTTNTATRWVAANTYTTAKKVQTIANLLPASAAAADNDFVVVPDNANYTGSITVEVNYTVTTVP